MLHWSTESWRPHGATQLPVKPRRGSQESTAGARGRAADGSVVVLGSYSEGPVVQEADRGEHARGPGPPSHGVEVARYPLTRATGEDDPPGALPVWDLEMFHRIPRGEDKWLLIHGRPRTRSFHPLHRSTPYPLDYGASKTVHGAVFGAGWRKAK